MTDLQTLALALAIALIVPAGVVAAWQTRPRRDGRGGGAFALDLLWTVTPLMLLAVLLVLSAGAMA
jgi:heme/copper-type cytochrome/quinol oxidase subunit 2